MKTSRRYIYAAGLSVGMIMTLVSVLVSFQMIVYLENGGSLFLVILASLTSGLTVGSVITYIIHKMS
ncbi:hypothetical protein COT94_00340 [Candidatus Falkowbacteria bacterium CG10_big_fil_rev_8_21_14_0_10_37_14]|uniref:Uncharacterized protein n=1 Tax=Candidatus Falkowbacteria bacterium CG10_big_fil_rev_8_21_14_0_10_37_14 TaxID=1974561 RepID=A0A2M6WUD4_9BACT|nr:hypothetical protein [Candidatus Falkowbacteria bacterium]PIT96397.1 MAG: hypothetical protein COT94_00340 [Candidatus Falkowbacteria bacterium CG10_big_fil_rev_8_21_14_0_10_37_14]